MEMVGVVVAQDSPHSVNPQMFPILMKILQGRYDPSFIPGAQESLAIYPGAPGNKKAVRSGTSWISAASCTCLAMSCDTVLVPARTLERAFQTHVVASLWSQLRIRVWRSPHCGTTGLAASWEPWDAGLILGNSICFRVAQKKAAKTAKQRIRVKGKKDSEPHKVATPSTVCNFQGTYSNSGMKRLRIASQCFAPSPPTWPQSFLTSMTVLIERRHKWCGHT